MTSNKSSTDPISIIPPRHQDVLNDSHVEIINSILEQICKSDEYISRPDLYEEIKEPLNLTMSKNCFCHMLTELFKAGKFPNFITRRGVHGGIYRKGNNDSSKELVSSSRIKVILSQVAINKAMHYLSIPEPQLVRFIMNVLDGSANVDGNVVVNNNRFHVQNVGILEKYIKCFDTSA